MIGQRELRCSPFLLHFAAWIEAHEGALGMIAAGFARRASASVVKGVEEDDGKKATRRKTTTSKRQTFVSYCRAPLGLSKHSYRVAGTRMVMEVIMADSNKGRRF